MERLPARRAAGIRTSPACKSSGDSTIVSPRATRKASSDNAQRRLPSAVSSSGISRLTRSERSRPCCACPKPAARSLNRGSGSSHLPPTISQGRIRFRVARREASSRASSTSSPLSGRSTSSATTAGFTAASLSSASERIMRMRRMPPRSLSVGSSIATTTDCGDQFSTGPRRIITS